jgi:hypothetical protein
MNLPNLVVPSVVTLVMVELGGKLAGIIPVTCSIPAPFYLRETSCVREKRSKLRGHPQDFEFFPK